MPASDAVDPLAALDPSARRAGPRVRVAVGAAVVLFVLAVAVAALMSFEAGGGGEQARIEASGAAADASADPSSTIGAPPVLVHVLGAVARPGLVELAAGARVVDAVAAAGGFTADADPAGVNLARQLVDGEQLAVPVLGQAPQPAGGESGASGESDGLVHLNSADVAELDTLPRIGPALAQRIIDWREANGPFTSVDQLLDVAGIGDAVFSGLEKLVAL
ncbi:competence protein ComEA [Agromyces badenianii]|uniref:Competence protein ComEA n=1 Tax=Agromyces badenianii TaxID=2080742 RepID=A0A2S0WVX2_9MICO|nr:ComEA family DNA-binding protein [Agromyces badenianii]AWB95354.1 competence protein ComEA [Agromyces badenianii]